MGNLIWLASYPKSGNTWLRAFIHNLIMDADRPSRLNEITRFFESESDPRWYQPLVEGEYASSSFDDFASLRPRAQRAIANSVARGSVFTKTHNQLTTYQGTTLHDLEKTAAAIYVVRNPLDVTISAADHFGLSIDQAIDLMAEPNTATDSDQQSVGSFLGSWSQHVESWTNSANSQFLVLRYEDLIDKPMFGFGKVARLLGLDDNKARIKKAIKFSSFRELHSQEAKTGFAERSQNSKSFFRKGKKFQWLEVLNEQQITQIISHHREQMDRFDYVPPKFR